jgi:hypothetical protein
MRISSQFKGIVARNPKTVFGSKAGSGAVVNQLEPEATAPKFLEQEPEQFFRLRFVKAGAMISTRRDVWLLISL